MLLALALASPLTTHAQTRPPLTLADAVLEALARNPRILDQRDAATQAELNVRLARNTFTPKVVPNVAGSFGQTNVANQDYRVDVTQKFVTGTQLRAGVGTSSAQVPGADGNGVLRFYDADTTLALSQPLLRGLGVNATRRFLTSAEVREADARRDHLLVEQQVAIQTASAYYRLVAQRGFVEVARKSFERASKLREASEAKLAAGLVSQLDVLRAEQLVSQAEIQVFDTESAMQDAADELSFLMGREDRAVLDLDGGTPMPNTDVINAEAAVALALQNRLELKTLAAHAADSERQLSFTRNQLLPQVDVNLALTRRVTADTFASSFGIDGYRLATFFTIATPVDRTPQLIEFANARIDRERQAREMTQTRRQITDQVTRALRERDRLLRGAAAAEAAIDVSQREVEVAQLRYERGLSNNLDVVTAESNLLAAESRRIQALADLAVARLTLRAALGIFEPRRDVLPAALAGPLLP